MTKTVLRKKAFPFGLDETNKRTRVFCFHHAGGSVAIFNKWRKHSSDLEIIPVELQGRGTRMDEPCTTDFNKLVAQSTDAIAEVYDGNPFFVYGHSLGAIIAFETVCKLQQDYNLQTGKLFVAGRQAPMDKDSSGYKCSMGIEPLKQELLQLGMIDNKTIENNVFKKYFLSVIYKDYQLHENYKYQGDILNVPVVAMSGKMDDTAGAREMERWRYITNKEFSQYEFEGNHFFPYEESEDQTINVIFDEIDKTISNNE